MRTAGKALGNLLYENDAGLAMAGRALSRTSFSSAAKSDSSSSISTGRAKSRNVFTARSSRSISLSSILTACCGPRLGGNIALQHFEPHAHGIQRIFHFVRDAGGDAPERGQPLGNLNLRAQPLVGFEVAQREQASPSARLFR